MKKSKLLGAIVLVGMLSACGHANKHSVYFEPGSAKLSQSGIQSLQKVAMMAKSEQKFVKAKREGDRLSQPQKIHLKGFADSTGDKKINKKLSDKRVLAVRSELMKLGINPTSISSITRGEGWIDTNGKPDQSERRVDVLFY